MNLDEYYIEEVSESIAKLSLKGKINFFQKALFLDRDGVLMKDVNHINSPNKVELCPNVVNFLKGARDKGYAFIVITNQSSVSRSIISYSQYKKITARFLSFLPRDLYPELILSSFHLPENQNNLSDFNWRKPGTGMIDYALKLGKYNKLKSAILGDKLTDLIAGYRSGLSQLIHIKSEIHSDQTNLIRDWSTNKNISICNLDILDFSVL